MSDREDLAKILALPDTDDAAIAPGNDQPPVAADAEQPEEEDDGPLSAEELVAAAIEQDNEEEGFESSDDGDESEDDEDFIDEDDLAELRRKAALFEANDPNSEANRLNAHEAALRHEYDTRVAAAQSHYQRELLRLYAQIDVDAENAPNPDAYKRAHRESTLRAVESARDTFINGIATDVRARAEVIFHQRNKPAFAQHLIAQYGLPDHPLVVAELMKVSHPAFMPERAEWLKRTHTQLEEQERRHTQALREAEAAKLRATQVHPGASGKPRRTKPVKLTGSKDELRALLALGA